MGTLSTFAAFIISLTTPPSMEQGTVHNNMVFASDTIGPGGNKGSITIGQRNIKLVQASRKAIDPEKFIAVGPMAMIKENPGMLVVHIDSVKEIFSRAAMSKIDQTITPQLANTLSDIKITFCDAIVQVEQNCWFFWKVPQRKCDEELNFRYRAKAHRTYLISLELALVYVPPPDKFTLRVFCYNGGYSFDQDFIINRTTKNVSFILESGNNPWKYNEIGSGHIGIQPNLVGGLNSDANYSFTIRSIRVKEL